MYQLPFLPRIFAIGTRINSPSSIALSANDPLLHARTHTRIKFPSNERAEWITGRYKPIQLRADFRSETNLNQLLEDEGGGSGATTGVGGRDICRETSVGKSGERERETHTKEWFE